MKSDTIEKQIADIWRELSALKSVGSLGVLPQSVLWSGSFVAGGATTITVPGIKKYKVILMVCNNIYFIGCPVTTASAAARVRYTEPSMNEYIVQFNISATEVCSAFQGYSWTNNGAAAAAYNPTITQIIGVS